MGTMRSLFDILILPMPLFSMTKFSKDLRIDNKNPFSRGINIKWMVHHKRPLGTFYTSYRFLTVISRTKKPLSTFSQTYVLFILNRNKVKATEKLSAPIRKNGLEYEERFQVERERRFLAVIFVILLSRITIKNLPTFTCLLDYCGMHKHQTHQISH